MSVAVLQEEAALLKSLVSFSGDLGKHMSSPKELGHPKRRLYSGQLRCSLRLIFGSLNFLRCIQKYCWTISLEVGPADQVSVETGSRTEVRGVLLPSDPERDYELEIIICVGSWDLERREGAFLRVIKEVGL